MSPIRTIKFTLVASLAVTTLLTGCQLGTGSGDAAPIVVGVDLELSGSGSEAGRAYEQALTLRVEQLNEQGGLGRPVELRIRDNRSDPTESERNIVDLAADRSVAGIITGGCNECAIKAAAAAGEQRIPLLALAGSDAITSPLADRPFAFKIATSPRENAGALLGALAMKRVRSFSMIRIDDTYGAEGQRALREAAGRVGMGMGQVVTLASDEKDLSGPVGRVLRDNPSALVVIASAQQAAAIVTEARGAGYRGEIVLDPVAGGSLFQPAGTDGTTIAFSQTMVIDDIVATTPAKAMRLQWFRDYSTRFGDYSGLASYGADALTLLTEAVVRSEVDDTAPDREEVRRALETSQADGFSGSLRLTPENHSALMPQSLTLLSVRGGRWRLAFG
ncbi:ABC transporter substrate-binding protein [Micromonosporaceae bacterium DT55]|uniref:ABC transporter substrate-binding protein n=1 Tax=Melissospora conviva TaxID=3388432 RepID=UPI003C2960C0